MPPKIIPITAPTLKSVSDTNMADIGLQVIIMG